MYQLTRFPDVIIRLPENIFIGASEENPDYQEYLRWVAAGNKPLPAEPVPDTDSTIPTRLTPEEKLQRAGLTVDELKLLIAEPVRELIALELHDTAAPPAIDQV